MRTFVALLLTLVAGLLTAASVAGARLDAVFHTPEPLQQIAGPVLEREDVHSALPSTIAGAVQGELPDELPDQIQGGVAQLAESASAELLSDDRFSEAWSRSLDQTRTGWLADLESARQQQAGGDTGSLPADAATVDLQLGPIADLGQLKIVEALRQIPFGDLAVDVVEQNTPANHQVAVDLNIPDPAAVEPSQVVWLEGAVRHWPWLAVGAVVSLVLALVIAPGRRRWWALAVAGFTALVAGGAGRWALESISASGSTGLARSVAEGFIEGVQDYAVPDTTALMVGGGIVAVLGILGAIVHGVVRTTSPNRSRR